ncbi:MULTISPECIES: ribosome recycling factor [Stappiaceae]|jgi:ribosome recycling factor|uniref:Ribosome-recycling factor n=2 Tax=Roseibium alexandrii TaxID=388408 RepID=A0A0M7AG67_9HYPH|nr:MULTISPECIES: ribosome recycling factor [Stappiaceae]OJJ12152.1 ribosome recycling factor [Alphaproteobacteria bacterium AO1-B]EEE47422.1 ribosome recycling factor [Roseibium alexandrii DFL-11]MBO9418941.1 ribosome recycling factor [Labrenzia sp. R4_2]MBO9426902.1 ribosome recycling factor [Labrenzia sp. R4_1]CTQ73210.1 Ribosome-releasing factor [Roseibium alexandrii]
MSVEGVDLDDLKRRMQGALSSLKTDFSGLRTGRASASMLDPISVDAYGQSMPLSQVGTVSVPEPRMVAIQVWDKSMVAAVEKAIRESNLGLNPVVDGQLLRLPIPELNQERRQELIKVAHKYAEQAKVAIRHVRRDGMDDAKKAEKDGEISQDDSRVASDEVQKLTDGMIGEVDAMLAKKEAEISQV